jgi:hypothetical protein
VHIVPWNVRRCIQSSQSSQGTKLVVDIDLHSFIIKAEGAAEVDVQHFEKILPNLVS